MLWILLTAVWLFKAATSQITGYGNTSAEYGGEAYYRCTVANPEGVLQVTWQRLYKDESIENLATYSKRFGEQVNEPYRGKVIFTQASLSSTSITLSNVTWGDESCYICSFNQYPDGSKRRQTCLTVQGISKVETKVHPPSIDEDEEDEEVEVVFSCSATGKPAPTIQWDFSSQATRKHQSQTTTVTNSDNTFTSSSNITLELSPEWTGHVDCLLNTGAAGQRQKRIFYSRPERKKKENGERLSSSGIALVIATVVFVAFLVVAAVTKRRRLNSPKRDETI